MGRSEVIDGFLKEAGWGSAKRSFLAGDASFRKYERIKLGDKHAVLMDAPPEKEDIMPFMRVCGYLTSGKLSAPQIIASDKKNGLLLLEDLGDDLFARVLEKDGSKEQELYLGAADVLVKLYQDAKKQEYKDIPLFDMERLLNQVSLLPEWFIPLASGNKNIEGLRKEYRGLWQNVLKKMPDLGRVLVLYDFHAENIFWLPAREKYARAGLIDFQDAMIGSPAYDMVSFLEDARRDVSAETVKKTIEYYLSRTGIEEKDFMAAYRIMGAQRNCRIAGTFARLAVRDNKPRYLAYMPRVWRHIETDLSHPLLAPIKDWMDKKIKPEWRGVLKIAA